MEAVEFAEKEMEKYVGHFDIEECITDNDKFDRRKFGKIQCPSCGKEFNPMYYKSYKEGEWHMEWVGCDHREPTAKCEIPCPKCKTNLHFSICVRQ